MPFFSKMSMGRTPRKHAITGQHFKRGLRDFGCDIWLANERAIPRNVAEVNPAAAGGDDDLDGRPTIPHCGRQLQTVHPAGHVDVREHDLDFGMQRKNAHGFRCVGSFEHLEPQFLQLVGDVHSDERFVFDHEYDGSMQGQVTNPVEVVANDRTT